MKRINLLIKHDIRNTYPRRKVIESIVSLGKKHFSVDDLIHYTRKKRLGVSRASIYRAISLFSKKGLLRTIDLGKDFYMYEPAYDSVHHDHIYCQRCGKIIEFEERTIEKLQKTVCRKNYFQPLGHTLRIVGLCKSCKTRRVK